MMILSHATKGSKKTQPKSTSRVVKRQRQRVAIPKQESKRGSEKNRVKEEPGVYNVMSRFFMLFPPFHPTAAPQSTEHMVLFHRWRWLWLPPPNAFRSELVTRISNVQHDLQKGNQEKPTQKTDLKSGISSCTPNTSAWLLCRACPRCQA